MESTTTYGVWSVDRVRTDLLGVVRGTGAEALALVTNRCAPLTGGPRIAPVAAGLGGELRPQRVDRSAERGGRVLPGSAPVGRGDRDRGTPALMTHLAPAVGADLGFRHLRSCGTPVPGSAPSATAP